MVHWYFACACVHQGDKLQAKILISRVMILPVVSSVIPVLGRHQGRAARETVGETTSDLAPVQVPAKYKSIAEVYQ
jgi:hypothetical protein